MNAQIKDLPDFDQVQREVQRHLKRLSFYIWTVTK
jgi:hypothetical protein